MSRLLEPVIEDLRARSRGPRSCGPTVIKVAASGNQQQQVVAAVEELQMLGVVVLHTYARKGQRPGARRP
jgi:hypothetical protein